MIHLRPDSTAYTPAVSTPDAPAVGGYTTPDNTVLTQGGSTALVDAMQKPQASILDSFTATLSESLGAKALRGLEYMQIPSEDGFSVSTALGDAVSQYTADELEFLADARSKAELSQRQSQVQDTRNNYDAMGQNMLTSVAASMLDVDMVIGGGVGALSKVGRAVRLAAGLAANTAVLGLASQGGTITPLDVIGTSVGVALSAIPGVRKAAKAAEDATDTTPEVAAKVERVEPATDYPTIKLDTYSNKPHIQVGRTVSDAPEIVTDVRNAVNAVLDLGDDLPEGVRALGRALSSSLDADDAIPVVFRKTAPDPYSGAPRERSFTQLLPDDGTQQVKLLGNDVAPDLSSHVRSLSTYDKSIILHEAAHAKTQRSLASVAEGTVTEGPVYDAAKRIGDIRQYVQSALKFTRKGKGTKYALNSDDEFISQLFNAPDFREALTKIKMPDSKGSVLSNVVKHVVSLFTKSVPTGSAFDETLKAFEGLLQQPIVSREVFLSKAADVPKLQNAVLNAPDARGMLKQFGAFTNRNTSLYERIKSYGPKSSALADRLVVDSTGTTANSAVHYARAHNLASNVAIVQVDASMAQALSKEWPVLQRVRHPKMYREAQRTLSASVYDKLAENHSRFLKGQEITPSTDPAVNNIIDQFVKSDWAQEELRRIKASGISGAEDIKASPYYLPRQHSGSKLNTFLRDNTDVTREDIVGMYTEQFQRMFRDRGIEDTTAAKLGRKMFDNMQNQAANVQGFRKSIAGMSYDEIQDALEAVGASDATVKAFLDDVGTAGTEQNKLRNLRGRAEFDMTADYVTKSGRVIQPNLFVNNDVLGLMDSYSRRMAGRTGLANAGFPDLRDAVKAIDDAVAEADDPAAALKTLDNTMNQLLGYPTGEDVPDILRSLSIASGAVNLKNSGIYQLADIAYSMYQFGIAKTIKGVPHLFGTQTRNLFKNPEFGSRLQDVLQARHVMSGKYRSILTHLDDNTDIGSIGFAHQLIHTWGQGTRIVNGMEFVRRSQVKLVSGLIADTVEDAIKGNASAITAMGKFGLDDDLLIKLREATKANPDMRVWPDSVRSRIESVAHNMADSVVLENRLGEIPAWLQFSAVGKIILPYMSFVAGAWNKVLRRTIKLDGTTGIAMALMYQLPLTALSSSAAMYLSGKEVDARSLTQQVLTQVPMASWLGYGVGFATGGAGQGVAALSVVDKSQQALSSIANGDVNPNALINAVPFLSVLPGIRLMGAALEDDDNE